VDTNEVPTITADDREARLVRPLVEDLLAHLAQLGGLARVSSNGDSTRHSGRESWRSSAFSLSTCKRNVTPASR
jgi:hypothetical protein